MKRTKRILRKILWTFITLLIALDHIFRPFEAYILLDASDCKLDLVIVGRPFV